jgi:hypothetical protein
MAILMTQYTNYIDQSMTSTVCRTRTDLLDRLADAVESLGRAKLDLRNTVESGDLSQGDFVRMEVERLRKDCGSIRVELEYHRANHRC